MRIVIASSSVPHIDGGGRMIVTSAAAALRAAGHDVEEYFLPFPAAPGAVLPALLGMRLLPFRRSCDRLIAIRWPAHVLAHDNKATWFIHHYRMVFDLWDTPYRNVPDDPAGRAFREHLRAVDGRGLAESRDLFSNSLIVRDRIRQYNGLEAEPLFPPLGGDHGRFSCDGYGDFIFYPSRITTIKRQLLAVEAMQHTRTPVRLVIAGRPEDERYRRALERAARSAGDRVELRFGWLPDDEKNRLLAQCLAVAYIPIDEDSYGYPTLEASHAAKAVVTLSDAGGVLEFVRDGTEGLVAAPDARSLAAAFDRLYEDRRFAEELGVAADGRRRALRIDWDHVVERLVGTS